MSDKFMKRKCRLCGKTYRVPKGTKTHATCPDCAPMLLPVEQDRS